MFTWLCVGNMRLVEDQAGKTPDGDPEDKALGLGAWGRDCLALKWTKKSISFRVNDWEIALMKHDKLRKLYFYFIDSCHCYVCSVLLSFLTLHRVVCGHCHWSRSNVYVLILQLLCNQLFKSIKFNILNHKWWKVKFLKI